MGQNLETTGSTITMHCLIRSSRPGGCVWGKLYFLSLQVLRAQFCSDVIFQVNFTAKADRLMFFDGRVSVVNEFNIQIFQIFYCVELEKLKQKYKLGRI